LRSRLPILTEYEPGSSSDPASHDSEVLESSVVLTITPPIMQKQVESKLVPVSVRLLLTPNEIVVGVKPVNVRAMRHEREKHRCKNREDQRKHY